MKKMRYIKSAALLVTFMVWPFCSGFTQATLSLGSVSGAQTSIVAVPVNATGIADMAGFQFTIQYDNTKLTFVNCTGWSGGIHSGGVQIVSIAASGKLTFVYDDVPVNIDAGKFFDINFTIINGSSGTSDISWSDNPTSRELYNTVPEIISCTYNNGLVTITQGPPLAYSVIFNINSNGSALDGASVTLSGYGIQVSGTSGNVTFINVNPSVIFYTVSKTGYYEKSGTITIISSNLTQDITLNLIPPITYNVTFLIRSGSLPVTDASITLTGYGSKKTDSNGSAVFTNVAPSQNLPYSIEKQGYSKKTGSISVFVSDITEQVALTSLSGANLLFGQVSGGQGQSVSMPVMALNMVDITGFQFTVIYDKSRLSYVNCSDWGGGANSAGVQVNHLANDGKLTFIYNDVPVNISSGRFFNINFTVNNNSSGDASIYWSDNPTIRELSNSVPEVVSCSYSDGSIIIIAALLPEVVTLKACPVNSATAAGGGIVTSDGGGTVNSRGLCWSISPDPTILDSKSIDGNGTGEFASNLNGLSVGLVYHVRAYATNSAGTGYGNDLTFLILPPPGSITASDELYWDKITIGWASVTGADSYIIFRGNSYIGSSLTTSFTDAIPLAGNAEYKVYPNNSCGMSFIPGIDIGSVKAPVLSVSSSLIELEWNSGSIILPVTSNLTWSVSNKTGWLIPTKLSEAELRLSFSENTGSTTRNDTIRLYSIDPAKSFEIAIVQNTLTTGMENTRNTTVEVYPNPVSRFLNLKMQKYSEWKITLSDNTGKQLARYIFSGELFHLNLESCHPGLYLLSVEGDGYFKTFKILKKE